MNLDLKQAILECLTWYYDHIYDGYIEPSWVDTMIEHYCEGLPLQDHDEHITNEMSKFRRTYPTYEERCDE